MHFQEQVLSSSCHNPYLEECRAEQLCLQKELHDGDFHDEGFQEGFHETSVCNGSSKLKLSALLSQTLGELEMAEF